MIETSLYLNAPFFSTAWMLLRSPAHCWNTSDTRIDLSAKITGQWPAYPIVYSPVLRSMIACPTPQSEVGNFGLRSSGEFFRVFMDRSAR